MEKSWAIHKAIESLVVNFTYILRPDTRTLVLKHIKLSKNFDGIHVYFEHIEETPSNSSSILHTIAPKSEDNFLNRTFRYFNKFFFNIFFLSLQFRTLVKRSD